MDLQTDSPVFELAEGQVLTLVDAAGTRILASRGSAWITEEGDLEDHILRVGGEHVVGHGGRTVVQALSAARIAIRESVGLPVGMD